MMGYYAIYALTAAANGQELEDVPTAGYWYDSTNMDARRQSLQTCTTKTNAGSKQKDDDCLQS